MADLLFRWRSLVASEHGPESATTRLLLLTLSLHMDPKGGSCWPSTKKLSSESGLSERVVCHHLGIAASAGWVEKSSAGIVGKKWKRNQYQAIIPEALTQSQHLSLEGTDSESAPNGQAADAKSAPFPEGTDFERIKAMTQSQSSYSIELSSNKQRTFLLKDKTEFEISDDLISILSKAYPSVDLEKEIRSIQAWCHTNPENRKTRRGAPAFVNRWMQRASNGNGSRPAAEQEEVPKEFDFENQIKSE